MILSFSLLSNFFNLRINRAIDDWIGDNCVYQSTYASRNKSSSCILEYIYIYRGFSFRLTRTSRQMLQDNKKVYRLPVKWWNNLKMLSYLEKCEIFDKFFGRYSGEGVWVSYLYGTLLLMRLQFRLFTNCILLLSCVFRVCRTMCVNHWRQFTNYIQWACTVRVTLHCFWKCSIIDWMTTCFSYSHAKSCNNWFLFVHRYS